jgi:hypothetical protein
MVAPARSHRHGHYAALEAQRLEANSISNRRLEALYRQKVITESEYRRAIADTLPTPPGAGRESVLLSTSVTLSLGNTVVLGSTQTGDASSALILTVRPELRR